MRVRTRNTILIGLGVIAVLAIGLDIHLMVDRNNITHNPYPYLDPEQGFYNDNDLLVSAHPLRTALVNLAQGKNIAIYFEFLNTGLNLRINDTAYFPGSLMKVPVAMAAMKKIETGDWSLDDRLELTDADKNSDYGTLYQLPTGTTFSIDDLLGDLLVQSDDTARAIFIRNLGDQNVEDVLTYLGLDDVVNSNMKVTPQRYSNFWRSLYAAGYLSAEDSQHLIEIMAQPHDEELLPAGLPAGVTISHKIGVYGDVVSDSGIVYVPNRPYILTVMMESSSTADIDATMKEVSQDVYQFVTQ